MAHGHLLLLLRVPRGQPCSLPGDSVCIRVGQPCFTLGCGVLITKGQSAAPCQDYGILIPVSQTCSTLG